jgi:hypothetical protein
MPLQLDPWIDSEDSLHWAPQAQAINTNIDSEDSLHWVALSLTAAADDVHKSFGWISIKSKPSTMSTDEAQDPVKADEVKPGADEKNSRKLRPTRSTHFGDTDFDDEEMADIGDATWAEVGRACCVHSSMEWGKIFIGVCAAFFFLYFFLFSLELLGSAAKVVGGCTAGKIILYVPFFVGSILMLLSSRRLCLFFFSRWFDG